MEFLQENETRQNSFSRVCLASSFLWLLMESGTGEKGKEKGQEREGAGSLLLHGNLLLVFFRLVFFRRRIGTRRQSTYAGGET